MRQSAANEAFLSSVGILKQLSRSQRRSLGDALTQREYAAGETIIREGERGDDFFIVQDGAVVITKEGREVGRLGPGKYFGEIALLTGESRAATISASEDTTCLSLDRQTFQRLLGPLDAILRQNMSEYHRCASVGEWRAGREKGVRPP